MDIDKVLHELDTLPARVTAKLAVAEEKAAAASAHQKTDRQWQMEVTEAWKKFVAEKKKNKTNGVC